MKCPVCSKHLRKDTAEAHVNSHFKDNNSSDAALAKKLQLEELASEASNNADELYAKNLHIKETESLADTEKVVQRTLSYQNIGDHVDDEKTRTPNIMSCLKNLVTAKFPDFKFILASECDHFAIGYRDRGFGCGYRNLQAVLSTMIRDPTFLKIVFSGHSLMPSISRLQTLIEVAWMRGFDPVGATQLGGRLSGTRKWIGGTEIAALFGSLRLACKIIDFPMVTESKHRHEKLMTWVVNYFVKASARQATTPILPLYFQHQGHSRLIVGVRLPHPASPNNRASSSTASVGLPFYDSPRITGPTVQPALVVLDPSRSLRSLQTTQNPPPELNHFLFRVNDLTHKEYQLVQITGFLNSEEEIEVSKLPENIHTRIE